MKRFLFVLILFVSLSSFAQPSDFILLKKNNITIASYYEGSHITFTATDGANVDADIVQIKNDTLFLRESIVRQVPTALGVYMLDTTNSYLLQYNYNDIKSFGKTGRHFDWTSSGYSLFGGGILLTAASGVVYLADRNKFSPGLLIAGITLGTIGYFLGKHSDKGMVIGEKYTLEYVSVSGAKKE
jgi:hypothetical protein